jgi:hypothetical protein
LILKSQLAFELYQQKDIHCMHIDAKKKFGKPGTPGSAAAGWRGRRSASAMPWVGQSVGPRACPTAATVLQPGSAG